MVTEKEFSQLKTQAREPLRQIEQEKQNIKQTKSSIKSKEQLESEGYKKQIRGLHCLHVHQIDLQGISDYFQLLTSISISE